MLWAGEPVRTTPGKFPKPLGTDLARQPLPPVTALGRSQGPIKCEGSAYFPCTATVDCRTVLKGQSMLEDAGLRL